MGFREVVPGVLVNENKGFKVSIPHPDFCWVIRNPGKTSTMFIDDSLLIFSNEENAHNMMKNESRESYVLEGYSWNDLVDKFGGLCSKVILDNKGDAGFYQCIPLKKGI